MNCSENYYELIGSIEAYPDDAVTFSRPFNIEKKSDKPDFSVSGDRKISIQMKPKSGSLKESAENQRGRRFLRSDGELGGRDGDAGNLFTA